VRPQSLVIIVRQERQKPIGSLIAVEQHFRAFQALPNLVRETRRHNLDKKRIAAVRVLAANNVG